MNRARTRAPRLIAVGRDRRIPASFSQEERMPRSAPVRHMPLVCGFRIDGPFEQRALESALSDLLGRHENLRITLTQDDEGGTITIAPTLTDYLDIDSAPAGLTGEQRLAAGIELVAEHARRPFDVARGPLFRAIVVRVDAECHLLAVTVDHIISDGWSRAVMEQDLVTLYCAHVTGTDPQLERIPAQFADFAVWERNFLTGERMDRLTGYWKAKLDGVGPVPRSRLIDPEALGGAAASETLRFTLSARELKLLDGLVKAEQSSVAAVVGGALKAAVAHRRSDADPGQRADVGVMGSAGNRLHAEIFNACGYFATPIVFRTNLAGDPTLAEVIRRETATVLEAMAHQQLPHALVIKALDPSLYGARHKPGITSLPPYVNFNIDKERGALEVPLPEVRMTPIRVFVSAPPAGGFHLKCSYSDDRLSLQLDYRTDLYTPSWAAGFFGEVQQVLGAALVDPTVRLSAVLPPAH